jgi:hypothetical protein
MAASLSPLLRKLQWKEPARPLLLGVPDQIQKRLSAEGQPPAGRRGKNHDAVLVCWHKQADVQKEAADLLARLAPEALFWTAYPKKSSALHQDLDRDNGWLPLVNAGWLPVRAIALNDDWSSLRWRPKANISKLTRKFETR